VCVYRRSLPVCSAIKGATERTAIRWRAPKIHRYLESNVTGFGSLTLSSPTTCITRNNSGTLGHSDMTSHLWWNARMTPLACVSLTSRYRPTSINQTHISNLFVSLIIRILSLLLKTKLSFLDRLYLSISI